MQRSKQRQKGNLDAFSTHGIIAQKPPVLAIFANRAMMY
jgi:hypothetical protein